MRTRPCANARAAKAADHPRAHLLLGTEDAGAGMQHKQGERLRSEGERLRGQDERRSRRSERRHGRCEWRAGRRAEPRERRAAVKAPRAALVQWDGRYDERTGERLGAMGRGLGGGKGQSRLRPRAVSRLRVRMTRSSPEPQGTLRPPHTGLDEYPDARDVGGVAVAARKTRVAWNGARRSPRHLQDLLRLSYG
jgi:hypothetical protein